MAAKWWDADPDADPFDVALATEGVKGPIADIARSIYQQESSSGKNTKTSNAGAVGGMQIIPGTFKSVADEGWDINDPVQNSRAGIRYLKQLYKQADGDPALTAAGYYGGPGGLEKARRGVAVSDPRNPNAPTTLQYGEQVAARLPKQKGVVQQAVESVIPSANAAEPPSGNWWDEDETVNPADIPLSPDTPRVEVRGTSADEPQGVMDTVMDGVRTAQEATKNVGFGALRGAGSIGATVMAPYDIAKDAIAGKGLSLESNRLRRADMDAGLASLGADPESTPFQGGKLAGEIAGTAGVGNLLGLGARALGAAPKIVNALQSGGMTLNSAPARTVAEGATNLLTRAAGGAVTGGASAGLVDPDQAGAGAMIGGTLPVGSKLVEKGGNALGRMITDGGVAPEVVALADRAKQLGIDIPADRLVDSKPLNAAAATIEYFPFSGRAGTMKRMEDQMNRAVSRSFGQDSPNVTQALRKASDDLGTKFDAVLSNNTVKVDSQFLTDLADSACMASKELSPDGAKIISNQIDEILAKANQTGEIDGQAAYNIKKTLDRIGRRNSPEAYYALDLKGKLMEALNRSLGPTEAQAFATVRKQYGNMLAMEKIAQNGAEGGISIARLANMKNINNPELQELADIAGQFLTSRESNHGAMQRAVLGTGGAIASGFGAAPAVLAGMGAGRATNMLLNSAAVKDIALGKAPLNRLLGEPDLAQLFYRGAPVAGS